MRNIQTHQILKPALTRDTSKSRSKTPKPRLLHSFFRCRVPKPHWSTQPGAGLIVWAHLWRKLCYFHGAVFSVHFGSVSIEKALIFENYMLKKVKAWQIFIFGSINTIYTSKIWQRCLDSLSTSNIFWGAIFLPIMTS